MKQHLKDYGDIYLAFVIGFILLTIAVSITYHKTYAKRTDSHSQVQREIDKK